MAHSFIYAASNNGKGHSDHWRKVKEKYQPEKGAFMAFIQV